jgi:hypothetical protein
MCFASIQNKTSQTIRISGALVFFGATKWPLFFRFTVGYLFLIVLMMLGEICVENSPQMLKEIREGDI